MTDPITIDDLKEAQTDNPDLNIQADRDDQLRSWRLSFTRRPVEYGLLLEVSDEVYAHGRLATAVNVARDSLNEYEIGHFGRMFKGDAFSRRHPNDDTLDSIEYE